MGKLKVIILAAGEGTRMKAKYSKVLHTIFGKPILNYVVDAYREAGCDDIVIVAGDNMEQLKGKVEGAHFALQAERKGTGHAIMCAADYINDDDRVLIAYGDGPLIRAETIKNIILSHEESGAVATLVSCIYDDPTGYGRIIRKDGKFECNVEQRDATEEQKLVKEGNTGVACYNGAMLKPVLGLLKCDNAQNEYYATDLPAILKDEGQLVNIYIAEDSVDFNGINDKLQLASATEIVKKRINERHMLSGVMLWDPKNTYIGPDVKIGKGTCIMPGTIIEGNCIIGEDCEIGPNTAIKNSSIGNSCNVINSILDEATVHNHVNIGPFAYLRPGTELMDNVKIGDFVEVKKSVIGKGSKASHLAYIGDAEIGENVNFGCGAITVNYDGKNKFKTIIKDNGFIGSNASLVAPVTVEKGGYVTAGSTITDNVPENSLTFGRARQVNKEGRAPKF